MGWTIYVCPVEEEADPIVIAEVETVTEEEIAAAINATEETREIEEVEIDAMEVGKEDNKACHVNILCIFSCVKKFNFF